MVEMLKSYSDGLKWRIFANEMEKNWRDATVVNVVSCLKKKMTSSYSGRFPY